MIASFVCVMSIAAFLELLVSYCRSILASSSKVEFSARVREVAGIASHPLAAEDFQRLLQIVRLCPERGDDQTEIRAVGTYYGFLHVIGHACSSIIPRLAAWSERERQNCSYFAAVALDRRISYSRDLLTQQAGDRF